MKLTNSSIIQALPRLKPYKLFDGGGLYLQVSPQGGKYWRIKYRYNGLEKVFSIGIYPIISLKLARNKLAEIKTQLNNNTDPLKKEMAIISSTFSQVAMEWITKYPRKSVLKALQRDVFPFLGDSLIRDISPLQLLTTLRTLEERSVGGAHRMLQICSQIFRYGIATGKVEVDIAPPLKGAFSRVTKRNYTHLPENQLPQFLRGIEEGCDPIIKLAFQFLILTFVRSTELRLAQWEEIDWGKEEWRIPAERMKMETLHIVPLSKQALKILKELQLISGNMRYIFPGEKNCEHPLGKNTFLDTLYKLGYKGKTTVHGFRATASTVLNENGFPSDVIERQLAHTERNKVRASYNHAQYLPDRRKMLQWWGDFIDQQRGNNIVQMKRA